MEGLNKIISFVLGLVVVIVFFAVVTGKLDLKSKLTKTTKSQTISGVSSDQTTPTPTKTTTSTGLPVLFIPSLLGAAIGGSFLKKVGKKS